MRILSWNIRFQGLASRLDDVVAAIAEERPDLVTLQEVTADLAVQMAEGLASIGLPHVIDSVSGTEPGPHGRKKYQCLIASRWSLSSSNSRWRAAAPYPESLARATVHAPEGNLDVFTAHIPNGAGNGWAKIDTFHVLARALRTADDSPRILTGDFNEPQQFLTNGQLVTFGGPLGDIGGPTGKSWRDAYGDERKRMEWTFGVMSVLAGPSQHGLRDAYRELHGWDEAPVTHLVQGRFPRCFDHLYVSRHYAVDSCGYRHDWREQGLSDHSALLANIGVATRGK